MGNSKLEFVYQINGPFKWAQEELAFHSVFVGGSDWGDAAVPDIDVISKYLNMVGQYSRLNLVTTVGSCFFLRLVRSVNFQKVILFERNILELMKLGTLLKDFEKSQVGEVESRFADYFQTFLNMHPNVALKFEQISHLRHDIKSGLGKPIPPSYMDRYTHPELQINLSKDERRVVLSRMKKGLVREVWPRLPRINLGREVAVVFLSNIPRSVISDKDVYSSLVNGSGTIIIRSLDTESPEPRLNASALNPHQYWTAALEGCISMQNHVVHEVFPVELRKLQNSEYQLESGNFDFYAHDSASFIDQGARIIPDNTSILLSHILLGKLKVNSSHNLLDQTEILKGFFSEVPQSIERVVIAEFNPESHRGDHLRNIFPTTESLRSFYLSCLPSFEIVETRYSPGLGEKKRNVFFVLQRSC